MPTLPPCAALAAEAYHVPSAAIEAVARHETKRGIGVMSIQPGWLPILERAGFDTERVRSDICMNIAAGAWILAWAGVGNHAQGPSDQPPTHPAPSPSEPSASLSACVADAARKYRLPAVLFRAVLKTEGGMVGAISRNKNGSYDMGPAQINSSHLPELARLGISRDQVINDGCLNIHIGAWILSRALQGQGPDDPAEFWRRVGNYNSATPIHNKAYQARVWKNVQVISHSQQASAD